jgi:hypothetical protein
MRRKFDDNSEEARLLEAIADAMHEGRAMPELGAMGMLEALGIELASDFTESAWETSGCFEVGEAACYLSGHVSDDRLDEIESGSPLTEEELRVAKNNFWEGLAGRESGLSVYLYSLRDAKGREVCFTSAHGDDGDLASVDGPFASEAEARESRCSDWDDDCMTYTAW